MRFVRDLDQKLTRLTDTMQKTQNDIKDIQIKIAVHEASVGQTNAIRADLEAQKEKIILLSSKLTAAWIKIDMVSRKGET